MVGAAALSLGCAACRKRNEEGTSFSACSACHKVFYCSKACQVADWKAGHKVECKTLQNRIKGDDEALDITKALILWFQHIQPLIKPIAISACYLAKDSPGARRNLTHVLEMRLTRSSPKDPIHAHRFKITSFRVAKFDHTYTNLSNKGKADFRKKMAGEGTMSERFNEQTRAFASKHSVEIEMLFVGVLLIVDQYDEEKDGTHHFINPHIVKVIGQMAETSPYDKDWQENLVRWITAPNVDKQIAEINSM